MTSSSNPGRKKFDAKGGTPTIGSESVYYIRVESSPREDESEETLIDVSLSHAYRDWKSVGGNKICDESEHIDDELELAENIDEVRDTNASGVLTCIDYDESDEVGKCVDYDEADKWMPNMEVGMRFESRQQFQFAIQSLAINTRRTLRVTQCDPKRCYVHCGSDGCNWKCMLNKMVDRDSFRISTYNNEHTCSTQCKVKNLTSKWLAGKYSSKFALDPNRSTKVFRKEAISDLKIDITPTQAEKARRMALKMIEGCPDDQYAMLEDYAAELKRTNPGSTILIDTITYGDVRRFEKMYICFAALKEGYVAGCRPFLGFDGCHLKTSVGGILLTALAIDPNHSYFPVAFAIVRSESFETWLWFFKNLKEDLEITDPTRITFISDKQKGLINAVEEIFPGCNHRFCVRHLYANFKLAGFKSVGLKRMLWDAANATTEGRYRRIMERMRETEQKAFDWFSDKPPKTWSRAFFDIDSKCSVITNNFCESFNKTIIPARERMIVTMIDMIREYMMERMQQNRDNVKKYWKKLCWCPKMLERLHE